LLVSLITGKRLSWLVHATFKFLYFLIDFMTTFVEVERQQVFH